MSDLSKKLQIKPCSKWVFYNAPLNYLPLIEPLPHDVDISYDLSNMFDGIQVFVKNTNGLASSLKTILPLLKPETIFWISYPKKNSGVKSDVDKMSIWDELYSIGFKIVTSISIDDTWTAFRFKPVKTVKFSDSRNANIGQNEYGNYIDIDNKLIMLPHDISNKLRENTAAMSFYQQLSYSNKKEYVVWILSAKQEKTKQNRLDKMIEKLSDGKKNPTEK
ncbi:YdeI/OmpD-associated family protein [Mucilaginibacter sp.]